MQHGCVYAAAVYEDRLRGSLCYTGARRRSGDMTAASCGSVHSGSTYHYTEGIEQTALALSTIPRVLVGHRILHLMLRTSELTFEQL